MLKKAKRLTRPTPPRQDAPFRGQGRSKLPLPYGVAGMIPTARVQRGPSEAARCASTGIVLAPRPIFQHPVNRLVARSGRMGGFARGWLPVWLV